MNRKIYYQLFLLFLFSCSKAEKEVQEELFFSNTTESTIENISDGLKFRFNASGKLKEDQLSSDIDAINNGFVSISLFDYDLTRNIDLKKINWNIDGA